MQRVFIVKIFKLFIVSMFREVAKIEGALTPCLRKMRKLLPL